MMPVASVSVLAALAAFVAADVGKGPQPSPTPVAWEFELAFEDPKRIDVFVPGEGTTTYWYVLYTVSNPGRQGQRFFPLFQIVTEDLRVIDTDMGINLRVFDEIAARHSKVYKYLVPPTQAIGALLAGDDNARESVAIWRGVDLSQTAFSIFVAGLSGETRVVENPAYRADEPETKTVIGTDGRPAIVTVNPRTFTLRKTLEVQYTLPGSKHARSVTVPQRGQVRWVMR